MGMDNGMEDEFIQNGRVVIHEEAHSMGSLSMENSCPNELWGRYQIFLVFNIPPDLKAFACLSCYTIDTLV